MTRPDINGNTRTAYIAYLDGRLSICADEAEKAILRSCIDEAAAFDRSASPLGTLARLVRACDAIESGEASALAAEFKFETHRLRPGRTPLNPQTVDSYVRLRELADRRAGKKSDWSGPRRETIVRSRLRQYMTVRQDAQQAKPRPSRGSRARRVEEIIGSIPSPEARQDLRFTLEEGRVAAKKLTLLRKAIETNFPAVRVDELLRPAPPKETAPRGQTSSERECQILARIRRKLQDQDHLRHFGLTFDGSRLKLSVPPATPFLDKEEFEVMLLLLNRAITGD